MVSTKVNTAGLDYETKKKVALNGELISRRVQLSNIDIDHNGQLSIDGQRVASEEGVQKQLYKILNLSETFVKKFGKITDENTKMHLINMIKSGLVLSDVKKQNITVLGNPRTQLITTLLPGNVDYISNKMAFEVLERLLNDYSELGVKNFTVDENGGFNISLLSPNVLQIQADATGKSSHKFIETEDYNAGINFHKSLVNGINTEAFTFRRFCDNGAIIHLEDSNFKLNKLTDDALANYFTGITSLQKNGFAPDNYAENIQRGMHTNISFAELLDARSIILRNSSLKSENELKNFLPEFSNEVHKLASRGVDYAQCTDRQLENYPTGHKVWDVVNRLTDFGSHDYGFTVNNEAIQRQAGKLFSKEVYDSENVIVFKN